MKRYWLMAVPAAVAVLLVLKLALPATAAPTTATTAKVIEYKVVELKGLGGFEREQEIQAQLESLGKEGWELVTIASPHAVFKR